MGWLPAMTKRIKKLSAATPISQSFRHHRRRHASVPLREDSEQSEKTAGVQISAQKRSRPQAGVFFKQWDNDKKGVSQKEAAFAFLLPTTDFLESKAART